MIRHAWRRRTAKTVLVAFGASCLACGESSTEAPAPSTTSTVVSTTLAPPTTISLTDAPDALSDIELRKLVAPVALYPDVVLASLLPATTYPEQIHDAALWVDQQGGVVDAVPEDRGWDGSVAGLLQFPDVLRWADQNEPWTEEMGHAMTYQQGYVLRAIQDYRKDVAEAGNLESNAYHVVERDGDDIRIQPAKQDTVYVPEYDPVAATQPQPEGTGVNPWIAFGGGVVVGALGAWALYSIFDDDDDDDDDGRRRRRRRIRRVRNNYYYADRQRRLETEEWTPQARRTARRRRRAEAFSPRPLRTAEATTGAAKAGRGQRGVRPPKVRSTAAPATAPAETRQRPAGKQQSGVKKKDGRKQGTRKPQGKKQGTKKSQGKKQGKKQGTKKQGTQEKERAGAD